MENRSNKRAAIWISLVGVTGIVLLLAFLEHSPRTCEIRIDTGDLRYSVYGVVVEREEMEEPSRSVLLSASKHSAVLKPDWVKIPTKVGSNRPHRMCSRFYARAAAWSEIDEKICIAVAEDLARYINETHAEYDLPACEFLLIAADWNNERQRYVVNPHWTKDVEILSYLAQRGIEV